MKVIAPLHIQLQTSTLRKVLKRLAWSAAVTHIVKCSKHGSFALCVTAALEGLEVA
jgi:hypothetical protein